MKILIKIITFLFILPLFSQNKQVKDNLTEEHKKHIENINKATNFDEKYLATTKLIDFHNEKGNLDSIIVYGEFLFNKLKIHPNPKRSAKVSTYIGYAKIRKGLSDSALEWYLEGIDFANKQEDKNLYYEKRLGVALSKFIEGKTDESEIIFQECVNKTTKKDQEVKSQRLQKKYILIGSIIILIALLTLFYVYYQKLQTQAILNETVKKVSEEKISTLLKTQELELIKASIEGEEKERNRIAKELHDTIGGNLASIKLQLSSKNQKHIMNQIDETYHQVRDLSHDLTSEKFNKKSFSELLINYIQNIKQGSKQEINLELFPEAKINQLDNTIKTELFKIIQELITNTLKHANSTEVTIQVIKLENEVKLIFEDDGVGFNPNGIKEGIGIKNIKERLAKINGTFHIDSNKNRGTIVDIDVSL